MQLAQFRSALMGRDTLKSGRTVKTDDGTYAIRTTGPVSDITGAAIAKRAETAADGAKASFNCVEGSGKNSFADTFYGESAAALVLALTD